MSTYTYCSNYYSDGFEFYSKFRSIDIRTVPKIRTLIKHELKSGKSLACARIKKPEWFVDQVEYYRIDDYPMINGIYVGDKPFGEICVDFCMFYSSGGYVENGINAADAIDYYLEYDANPPLNDKILRSSLFEYEYYISRAPIGAQDAFDSVDGAINFYAGACMATGCIPRTLW